MTAATGGDGVATGDGVGLGTAGVSDGLGATGLGLACCDADGLGAGEWSKEPFEAPMPHALTHTSIAARLASFVILEG
jgi:hypothetical protein